MRKKLIIGSCLLICTVLFCFRVVSKPQADWDVLSKKYTYNSLTGYQLSLFESFIANEFPAGKTVNQILTDQASLRNETRLAQALLFRNKPGDQENAIEILRWILKHQHTDKNSKNYGMWRTNVQDDRLDQNWREFIGCDLIIIYQEYNDHLPADLLAEIRSGLIRAAEGALQRDVGADYTNISIMSAFLMYYTGTEFQMEYLKAGGLKKASDIYNLYHRHQTFSEYNSPTYDGVTLIALALWRELASEKIKEMGTELETALWNEIGSNYNPILKNMTGPYFRGYGMDMKKYCSIAGIWIAVAVDDGKLAPLPLGKGAKQDEMNNISPILHLGLVIPKSVLRMLKEYTQSKYTDRLVSSKIAGDTLKHITAMINSNWMMGGLWGNRRVWNQIKTGTIHWNNAGGETEWLLVPGEGNTNIRVTETTMQVYRADLKSTGFSIYVYAKGLSEKNFSGKLWKFPSMELAIQTKLKKSFLKITDHTTLNTECALSEEYPAVMKINFKVPANWRNEEPLLEITPTK